MALEEEKKILVICMLWQWWMARNKLNAEGKLISVSEVIGKARYSASETSIHCRKMKRLQTMTEQSSCQPPVGDFMKINCDGAYRQDTSTGGWSFVIRDQAQVTWLTGSVAQAEVHACNEK
jgi:hypothetical protein